MINDFKELQQQKNLSNEVMQEVLEYYENNQKEIRESYEEYLINECGYFQVESVDDGYIDFIYECFCDR